MAEDAAGADRDVAGEIRTQLGKIATGGGRDIRALAAAVGDERLEVAAAGYRDRRGWVIAATDRGVHLARRPLVFGGAGHDFFAWDRLSALRSGPQRLDLTFGSEVLALSAVAPHERFVALVEAARARLPGAGVRPTIADLREVAVRKLGRFVASANEAALEALPDVLEDGEVVQRMAQATLDFTGLLVVTDRRVLLVLPTLRRANERRWSVPRADVLDAVLHDAGVRLELPSGSVVLEAVAPAGRAEELVAVLARRD